jgi:hypothetical protein
MRLSELSRRLVFELKRRIAEREYTMEVEPTNITPRQIRDGSDVDNFLLTSDVNG